MCGGGEELPVTVLYCYLIHHKGCMIES